MASVCDFCALYASYECNRCSVGDCVAEITGCYRQFIPEDKAKELAEQRMVQWRKDYWRDERREHPFTWIFRWMFIGNPLESRYISHKFFRWKHKIENWNAARLRRKGYVPVWKWNKDKKHGRYVMVRPEQASKSVD